MYGSFFRAARFSPRLADLRRVRISCELQGLARGSSVTAAQVLCHSEMTLLYNSTVATSRVGSRRQSIHTRKCASCSSDAGRAGAP